VGNVGETKEEVSDWSLVGKDYLKDREEGNNKERGNIKGAIDLDKSGKGGGRGQDMVRGVYALKGTAGIEPKSQQKKGEENEG